MASALDILSSGKKTEKEFLDKTNDSLFIQTDDFQRCTSDNQILTPSGDSKSLPCLVPMTVVAEDWLM